MLAKGRTLVVVDFEPVRHVDLEALLVALKHAQARDSLASVDAGHVIILPVKSSDESRTLISNLHNLCG